MSYNNRLVLVAYFRILDGFARLKQCGNARFRPSTRQILRRRVAGELRGRRRGCFDGDCSVGILDLLILLGDWG